MALGFQDAPLAHPHQGPGASIPLQGLPLFPRGASGSWSCFCPSSWLGEGSQRAELWVQPGPRSLAADGIFPDKLSGEVTARSFSLACASACAFQSMWENFHASKSWGLSKRRGSQGAGKGSRERETKRRARSGGIVRRKSDQKPHSCTWAARGGITHGHEGIAHHLPPASGMGPGLSKSKGKP